MYVIFNVLQPKCILGINWIGQTDSLYMVWTTKNPKSKFIVVQHGSYVGGVVTDSAHKYTKCDIFYTWGAYFTNSFKKINDGKKTKILSFGNPVYNTIVRKDISYSTSRNQKILLAPSGIKGRRLEELFLLKEKLLSLGFKVYLKQHNMQESHFQKITDFKKIKANIFELLKSNEFDIIITDHSSLMLDGIFFKQNMIFFSLPEDDFLEATKNNYTNFLDNLYFKYKDLSNKEALYSCIDIDAQERLLNDMIEFGDNRIKL